MQEWRKEYNPFNSAKLMAHVERWSRFKDRVVPPPVLVTIDTVNQCNLSCPHCNSHKTRNLGLKLDPLLGKCLVSFLKQWGVRVICVAGGGEPLLHPTIITDAYERGLKVGVVTNGTLIDNWLNTLEQCEWVGVSVDAGQASTYQHLKGGDYFDKVIDNIGLLVRQREVRDAVAGRGTGVFYKYLILPGNEGEIAQAAAIAKSRGCKGFHARPYGLPWDRVNNHEPALNLGQIRMETELAGNLGTDDFGVYIVTHKFSPDLKRQNKFKNCWGCLMTMVITPAPDGYNIDLCCDRRGDKRLRLAENLTKPADILETWGAAKHWKIHESIDPQECPRCTYGPHSRLVEEAVLVDNTTYEFI